MAAIALFIVAVYRWRNPPVSPTELIVGEQSRTWDDLAIGQSEVVFGVTNPTTKTARIIGLQEG